jgi:DDE family transposase
VLTQASKTRTKAEPFDPLSLERGVRQLLAEKVMGNHLGLWLLVPELLRMGAWQLLCGWTAQPSERVEPRLALQLVHEAVLCVTGVRAQRSLHQRAFELANGLPFLATDIAVHELLGAQTVANSKFLQVTLGKLRRTWRHFQGKILAVDPHRIPSSSQRHMRLRCAGPGERATKMAQTFFVLDAETHQPLCFTTGTAARTATDAAEELLEMAADILDTKPGQTLVLADSEHFTTELLDHIKTRTNFDLLVPMFNRRSLQNRLRAIPVEAFQPHWAGYATAKLAHTPANSQAGPFYQFVQRSGERPEELHFKSFLSTIDCPEVDALTRDFPMRWHIEEFFNANQALGWNRAGTCNLNIRYAHMTMALIAQTAIHQFRHRLAHHQKSWDAAHLARAFFGGLEGDIRTDDHETIVVTFYNAEEAGKLRTHYENLPAQLDKENIDPRIPWLYNFKLDFRFR